MSRRIYRVPIHRDTSAFNDQTERMFRDMQLRMNLDFPSTQWSSSSWPVTDSTFYHLNPRTIQVQQVSASERGSREALDDLSNKNLFIEDPQTKSRTFRMCFDVKQYDAKEVQVRVEDRDVIVEAKQTKNGVTSEFSRKIQLPSEVEAEKLTSNLSSDGILTLQAPCPPKYPDTATSPQSSTRITTHVESSPSTSIQVQHTTAASPPSQKSGPVVISVLPCTPADIPNDTPVFTTIDGGRRRLDLVIDFGRQYDAKDVQVKLDGRKMIVEATHEEKYQGRVSKSSVQREFDLSEDVDPGTVQAMMRPDGQLAIVATSPANK